VNDHFVFFLSAEWRGCPEGTGEARERFETVKEPAE